MQFNLFPFDYITIDMSLLLIYIFTGVSCLYDSQFDFLSSHLQVSSHGFTDICEPAEVGCIVLDDICPSNM